MKKILTSLVLSGLVVVVALNAAESRLLTIVTSEDSLTQLMSMVLSNQAKSQGADVNVLFCGKAGDIVFKNSKEVTFKPKGMSPQKLLKKLIKSGGTVQVCPPYLPNNGKTKADLIEGVTVANPPKIAEKILDPNIKILSY